MEMNESKIHCSQLAILLMCYNGTQFLPELISSLQQQTYSDWTLFVQDDLSTDDTRAYLQQWAREDERVVYLHLDHKLGAMRGFMDLLSRVEAPYYMFCDQDDIWLPEKVELTMHRMALAEEQWGRDVPLVVHTDLRVVDRNLKEIAPSFWKLSRINPALLQTFDEQAGHNLCTGCTMLLNRPAREVSMDFSPCALMHDAWVTLCTLKQGGHVCEVSQPTLLYRQHGGNTLGAHDIQSNYVKKRMTHLRSVWRENKASYAMLRAAGYGGVFKYLYYKIRYYLLNH